MTDHAKTFNQFSTDEIKAFEPAMKIGVLATVNKENKPHVTMISTLKAAGEKELCWGQFIEGQSKLNIRRNPKVGWLIMNLQKRLWRGKAEFTHIEESGKDYDFYNNTPLFRYNSYFGIHSVYYMNLIEHTGGSDLPMNAVVLGAIQTMWSKLFSRSSNDQEVINGWTRTFLNKLDCLKFLSYIGKDGFPVVIPVIQAQSSGTSHLIFAGSVFSNELQLIPEGATIAVLGLALTMEAVLLRGKFEGLNRTGGVLCGSMAVDWVYNSMPPVPGQIYPPLPLDAVRQF